MIIKTFSEVCEKPPFDWHEALSVQDPEWINLREKSKNWVTCACGNQCDIIPRHEGGMPKDQRLSHLGYDFNYAIKQYNAEKALTILIQIENRSKEIIKELKKAKK